MHDDGDVTFVESGSGVRWFVLGAAIGVGLGLLFAPQAGSRTRRDLAMRGRKLRAKASDLVDDLADEVQERGREIRESVEELGEEILGESKPAKRQAGDHPATNARDAMAGRLSRARAKARAAVGAAAEDDDESE